MRLPITPGILLWIKEGWEKGPLLQDKTMLWAAMLLCFFGFFRSGEICPPPSGSFNDRDHLTFADVLVDNPTNPQQLHILLKRSKTGKGAIVGIGRTGGQLCPVAAVLSWMVWRGNAPGPLFHFQNGAPLTQQIFVVKLQKALQMIGEDPQQFGGHSFRAGATTTAAQQGIVDATIKLLGRWHSSAYQVYIKTPVSILANSGQFRQASCRQWIRTARCTAINKETLQQQTFYPQKRDEFES